MSSSRLALLGRMIGRSWLTPLPCCKTSLCTYGDSRATCVYTLSYIHQDIVHRTDTGISPCQVSCSTAYTCVAASAKKLHISKGILTELKTVHTSTPAWQDVHATRRDLKLTSRSISTTDGIPSLSVVST